MAKKRKVRKTTVRKVKTRKTTRKTSRRKKPSRAKKMAMPNLAKSMEENRKAHWKAYKDLQKRCDQAWAKLKADTNRKASADVITRDRNNLTLLLGECDYMARECMRMASRIER